MLASLLRYIFKNIDWVLFVSVLTVCLFGLVTMNSFVGRTQYFNNQFLWISLGVVLFFIASGIDWRFLKNTRIIVILFGCAVGALSLLYIFGSAFKGAQSFLSVGGFSFQPANIIELITIFILAKYFSRRHMEIAHIRHIIVSGLYVLVLFVLVVLQPDFGGAMIIFLLWLGMVLVSGISKKHLFLVFFIGMVTFGGLWLFIFKSYQKERIMTFLNPMTSILDEGYNVYQSTIAIGSGEVFGKGVGYGTQSKLQFLPEYQTDFIFAAYAEEWGFVGVIILFILYGIIFWRMLSIASRGGSNFEILYGVGLTILFFVHSLIHIGSNIGMLPVTGNTLSFMSYGGSHIMTEFLALGILMGMKRYARPVHRDVSRNEMVGV